MRRSQNLRRPLLVPCPTQCVVHTVPELSLWTKGIEWSHLWVGIVSLRFLYIFWGSDLLCGGGSSSQLQHLATVPLHNVCCRWATIHFLLLPWRAIVPSWWHSIMLCALDDVTQAISWGHLLSFNCTVLWSFDHLTKIMRFKICD